MNRDEEAEKAFWKLVEDSNVIGLYPALRLNNDMKFKHFQSRASALGYLARKNGFNNALSMLREFYTG